MPSDAPSGLCPQCLLSDGFGGGSEPTGRFTGRIQPRFVPPTIEELSTEFPQLHFVQLLGSGGMGAVYLANQIRLARLVAVKILPPDLADDAAFAERFLREARALARLSHPNIVGVFDFGQTPGGLYYFLMEYIEGPTLRQVVANCSADPKQALEIVRQVCDALQYAHDKGVVHRDIKPENVLLDSHGRVKIADFGLAKLLGLAETAPGSPAAGSLTGTRQAMGTPHYMAPEQITGSRSVDHRADIYSLGVVFYELLTGELPLGRFAAPSKKVQIDVRLDDVVLRTLEAEPAQRYQRAGDVKTDVETISYSPEGSAAVKEPGAALRFVRNAKESASYVARTTLEQLDRTAGGTIPRKVIAGWMCVLAAFLCLLLMIAAGAIGGAEAAIVAIILVGWIGLGAGIAAVTLGVISMGEIRRSDGRLTGIIPALGAALTIPLVILSVLVWFVCLGPGAVLAWAWDFGSPSEEPVLILATLLAIPAVIFTGVCVTRYCWRRAIRDFSPERIEREKSVIPPEFREIASHLSVTFDKVVRALKPIRRDTAWKVASASVHHAAHWTPPTETTNEAAHTTDKPILHPADPDDQPVPSPSTPISPRLSKKALVGAIWLMWLPLAAVCFFLAAINQRNDAIELPLMGLGIFCALPAAAAPLLTTILGWLAVGDIRRSSGRLVGLPLAVFDGLFFPLLLVDAAIYAVTVAVVVFAVAAGLRIDIDRPDGFLVAPVAVLLGTVIVIIADVLIVRAIWRKVTKSEQVLAAGTNHSPDLPEMPISDHSNRSRDLIAAGAAIAFVAVIFVGKAMHEGWVPFQRHNSSGLAPLAEQPPAVPEAPQAPWLPRAATQEQVAEAVEDANRRWRFGTNGPEVSRQWAFGIGIPEHTVLRIDEVLQDVYRQYEILLDEHTTVERSGTGVAFQVEPFPIEIDRLADEFWARVDPLLTREQQAILRYNFPLRHAATSGPISSDSARSDYDYVLLFGVDGRRSAFNIERTGQWYRWHFNSPIRWGQTTPELPHYLQRWEDAVDRLMTLGSPGPMPLNQLPVLAPKPAHPGAIL